MADAVVSFAVQKLGDFLIDRVGRRVRIKKDVEWLRNELLCMQSFLKDAEEKQSRDHLVQQWVSEIADLACDAVDILDEFSNINICRDEASRRGSIVDRVKRMKRYVICNSSPYNISDEIESVKQRLLDLSRKRDTYGITSLGHGGEGSSKNRSITRMFRRTTSYQEEDQFVGLDDVTNLLSTQLLRDDDRLNVISIYGMGGLGKTTLARRLYNSDEIQLRFACRAWVCVSQDYNIQDLLRTTTKSFKGESTKEELEMLERMNEEDLKRYLCRFLKGRSYLLVVDDVWQKEAWARLKRAFPDCQSGSRVIITARIKEVAERVDSRSFVHCLRLLRPEESLDLFMKKISQGDGHPHWFSPAMQEMRKEMEEKWGGLPLAIVVLGGLLSNKKELEDWHKVREQLWQRLKKDSIDISHLLSLSYDDLSSALQQCFLYVGIFPEDYVINAEKLMWLWMAEGYIPQVNQMEDIAEDYLHELINRSLIQVAGRFFGRIEACRIHDLLRDLEVEKAMKLKLFDIYDPRVYAGAPPGQRHVVHTQIMKFFTAGLPKVKLRSLVFFNPDSECLGMEKLTIICEKFKHLWILDLENVSFGSDTCDYDKRRLPDVVGDLVHLKFLGLLHSSFVELPPTIGNLKSLQTLEISFRDSSPCRFPTEISKLIDLRHLYIHKSEGPLKVDSLTNLRTLKGVLYDQWIANDSSNLINLRELVLEMTRSSMPGRSQDLDSLSNLKSLQALVLHGLSLRVTLPPLEPLSCCTNLLKLWLMGRIPKLPPFSELPQSLTTLYMIRSNLSEDPMPTLERLLNLRNLTLDAAYVGKEIICSSNGFQQLECLCLSCMRDLEIWKSEEGAMPVIRRLSIISCPKLQTIPEILKSISSIAEMEYNNDKNFYRQPYQISMFRRYFYE